MIIISIILWFLLILLLIVLFFISIPYKYSLQYSYNTYLNFQISISTFFFKIYMKREEKQIQTFFQIFNFKKEIKKESEEKEKKDIEKDIEKKVEEKIKEGKEKPEKKKSGFPYKVIKLDNIKHILRFIKNILYLIRPRFLEINMLLGLEDPYHNGLLSAYYYTLKGMYPKMPINIDLNWEEEMFSSDGKLYGYIIPIQLLFKTILFIFSIKTIKIGWEVFKYYRKDKVNN